LTILWAISLSASMSAKLLLKLHFVFPVFYTLLTCFYSYSQAMSLAPDGSRSTSSTLKVTQLLDSLIEYPRYDHRLRPQYGGAPVRVGLRLQIVAISAVNEIDMDFTLDFYLRQSWFDPR
jgi:Neurotransmitter-gated ion-channel ligand binding domain